MVATSAARPLDRTAARIGTSRTRVRTAVLRLGLVSLLALGTGAPAAHAGSARRPADGPLLATVPERPAHAITGSDFARRTDGWPEAERQRAAVAELEQGNLPEALRRLQPVTLRYQPPQGASVTAIIWVTPDYLSIGRRDDYLYIPLTWPSATEVARRFDCVLPTPRMVDAIYRQARVHLAPQPLPAGPRMRSNAYYERHQTLVEAQRAGVPLDVLVSGNMKDVVLTNRLVGRPDRVAIYGWHRLDGRPIQPLSTVHGVRYADYSHGIRLVWHEVWIDGVARPIEEVLADPRLAPVLSSEGPLHDPHRLLDPERAALAAAAGAPPGALPPTALARAGRP
jgi:hypothetical protein